MGGDVCVCVCLCVRRPRNIAKMCGGGGKTSRANPRPPLTHKLTR